MVCVFVITCVFVLFDYSASEVASVNSEARKKPLSSVSVLNLS